jgi:hypothetical protein
MTKIPNRTSRLPFAVCTWEMGSDLGFGDWNFKEGIEKLFPVG